MYLKKVSAENPGVPCFCFGHSTGGGIILKAVIDPEVNALVNGIILTSPAVRIQPAHPIVEVSCLSKCRLTSSERNCVLQTGEYD
jgi:acylglycerol lipase